MKKKFPIKRIILIALLVGAAGLIAFNLLAPKPVPVVYQRTAPLAVMDLKNTVDVTGTVASENSTTVHSTLGEPVTEIAVEVGDRVEEGDLLCRLDTAAIEADIVSKQASIASDSRSNQMSLEQANTDLYYANWYMENSQNSTILQAEQAVKDCERAVEQAKYGIRTAEDNLSEARHQNYEADADIFSDREMNSLRDAVASSYLTLEGAEADLAAAKQALNRAKWDAKAELAELQNAVTSAQNATDQTTEYISLQKLQDDLANCIINAPVSGTVTAVYAKEGAEAKGLLFVIENTQDLVVETAIKEFDINTVQPGMQVDIKSDATGDEVFEGEVLSIDPASVKDGEGNTVTGSTAEYAAKVRVVTPNSGLRIGMNARLNIITQRRDQKMAVFYDSVTTDAEGNSIVYVARPQEDGSYIAQAVRVETGMETDLYLEVSGELAEGDLILQDPMSITDGMVVNLMPEGDMTGGDMAGGGMGGMTVRVG